jgi:hypothetical protein
LFDTFDDDPVFEELFDSLDHTQTVRCHVYEKLRIFDDKAGSRLMESEQVPIYIHVPRDQVLMNTGSSVADVQCLKSLLQHHSKIAARGTKRNGVCTQYATFGIHAHRYKSGLGEKKVNENCLADYGHLKKMIKRMEFFASAYLPFGLLSSLRHGRQVVGDRVDIHQSSRQHSQSVWSSIATSFNYVSPAHVDKDAFLSCLTVSYAPQPPDTSVKFRYKMDMPVAVYFCFPQYNVAVGLRPGDVLFFNPLHYHCVSQRTEDYKSDEIYVTSFYIKSSQLSGNTNM